MDLKIAAARTHQALYERLAPHPADLRTWIEELNGAALKDPESDIHFVYLFVAIIDPEQRELAYINAGVVEPYFYRAKQRSVGRLKKNLPALA